MYTSDLAFLQREAGMIMFKIFFWLPNLKKGYCFGGRSGSCVPGDEKAKSGSYGALDATMTHPTLCHNSYRM